MYLKYLVVYVASGKTLSFNVSPIKRAFYLPIPMDTAHGSVITAIGASCPLASYNGITLRHDIAATCVLKMPLNPNHPSIMG